MSDHPAYLAWKASRWVACRYERTSIGPWLVYRKRDATLEDPPSGRTRQKVWRATGEHCEHDHGERGAWSCARALSRKEPDIDVVWREAPASVASE